MKIHIFSIWGGFSGGISGRCLGVLFGQSSGSFAKLIWPSVPKFVFKSLPNVVPKSCSSHSAPTCAPIVLKHVVPKPVSTSVPKSCPEIMSRNSIPKLCPEILSRIHVPKCCREIGSQSLHPRAFEIGPGISPHRCAQMFSTDAGTDSGTHSTEYFGTDMGTDFEIISVTNFGIVMETQWMSNCRTLFWNRISAKPRSIWECKFLLHMCQAGERALTSRMFDDLINS